LQYLLVGLLQRGEVRHLRVVRGVGTWRRQHCAAQIRRRHELHRGRTVVGRDAPVGVSRGEVANMLRGVGPRNNAVGGVGGGTRNLIWSLGLGV